MRPTNFFAALGGGTGVVHLPARQLHFENRAGLAGPVADHNLSPQPFDQVADDEQPQAGAGLRAFQLVPQPDEAAEDLSPQAGPECRARCR